MEWPSLLLKMIRPSLSRGLSSAKNRTSASTWRALDAAWKVMVGAGSCLGLCIDGGQLAAPPSSLFAASAFAFSASAVEG
jgi:hypothetical protein